MKTVSRSVCVCVVVTMHDKAVAGFGCFRCHLAYAHSHMQTHKFIHSREITAPSNSEGEQVSEERDDK